MPLNCPDIHFRMHALKTLKAQFDSAYATALSTKEQGSISEAKNLKIRLEQEMKDLRDTLPVVREEYARDILEKEVFGKDAVLTAFGIELKEADIPPIPFTPKELEQAKQEGWSLILRINKDNEGNPMTMEHIAELAQVRITGRNSWNHRGLLFADPSCALTTSWVLVANSFVPDIHSDKNDQGHYTEDTTNNNYIQQTKLLREYLLSLNLIAEKEAQACSDDILEKLSKDMGVDWNTQSIIDEDVYYKNRQEVAKTLSQLSINQQFRRSPAEILYDILIRFKTTKERGHLEHSHERSHTLSSSGGLVDLGSFASRDVFFSWWDSSYCTSYIGVSFSRSKSFPS